MPRIRPVKNLRDYFEQSVADSMRRNDIRVGDLTSSYVVDLLTLYSRSEKLFERGADGPELRPLALVLGVGHDTLAHLDMIPLIRAVRRELPVILIAEDASLELERRARQHKIFYYLVHPIQRSEVRAVLEDLLRARK